MENPLWCEKYRPRTVADTILPAPLKAKFQSFVDQQMVPHLMLAGGSGCGKTTVARAMLEELGCDYIVINGSMSGNIDTLRNEIQNFASSVSLYGGRKYTILDEADYLSAATQAALRNFMEEYSTNHGIIMTCNYKNRIIQPLHGRCAVVDFVLRKKDMPGLASKFMKRVISILDAEGVEYDKNVVGALIAQYYPDWRRVLNELQSYASTGKIDEGILVAFSDEGFATLIGYLKEKDFAKIRKWVAENADIDGDTLFKRFYDEAYEHVAASSIPQLVLHIAKYSYQAAFVANKEVNLAAFMLEVMVDCQFK